jgi:2-keto-3-deoxy-L-rhamnonate aldolase RhmA
MEHGQGEAAQALPCLRALRGAGAGAVLRVAANEAAQVKKALDLGPEAIMVPMVETAEQAAAAVAACRYPPRGIRGAAHPIVRASRYGIDPGYLRRCEIGDEILLILQIESASAVERIPEIAAVDGVDCLMVGPMDLSASLGLLHDPSHQLVRELQRRAEREVLSAPRGVYLAGFAMGPDDPPHRLFARGCHLVSGAVDVALFRNAALADVEANKVRRIDVVGLFFL